MVRSSLLIVVTLASFAALPAAARQAPDFSGTWVLASSQSSGSPGARAGGSGGMTATGAAGGGGMTAGGARMGGGGGGLPPEIVVKQTAASLTIERTTPSPMKWVYQLDGSESVNTNGRTTLRTKSRWEGGKLITEGTQTVAMDSGEVKGTIREVRSIAADGTLSVETTRTAEGMTNAAPVVTQTYKKK